MKKRAAFTGLAGLALLIGASSNANALGERVRVTQQGDFVLIGNTLAHDCSSATAVPVSGTGTPTCSAADTDIWPDIFWKAEVSSASASSAVVSTDARSTSVLTLPPGAEVTHAYLFWSARNTSGDINAVLEYLGTPAKAPLTVTGDTIAGGGVYHSSANVTAYVKAAGAGAYRVGGVSAILHTGSNTEDSKSYSAWWMAVLYKDPNAAHRELVVYDGIESIANGGKVTLSIDSLNIPKNFAAYSSAKVGVVGYDGDATLSQDDHFRLFSASGTHELADATGVPQNFFNSTRTTLKLNPVTGKLEPAFESTTGDFPQYTGEPGTMQRLDLDMVNITDHISSDDNGTAAEGKGIRFQAESGGEPISLAGVVTSIPVFTDGDDDGLSDDEEDHYGTDPNDADSDDDGVPDGQEGCSALPCTPTDPGWNEDTDGDGLVNALDPDADDDGLYDGTELGLPCTGADTDEPPVHCIPDADPKTTTDPLNTDTDNGGVSDGAEDSNLNGKIDTGETDPTQDHGSDDSSVVDTDGDGLSDGVETTVGSNPEDMDSDDDGLLDGQENNPTDDTDGDGLLNVLDVDSDNDGLADGTEAGQDCSHEDTDTSAHHCIEDGDDSTTTSTVDADTDNGGVSDGSEDADLDGVFESGSGETDPTDGHGADDNSVTDSDNDGLSDALEDTIGSNPNDADSDDDGVKDGEEANPADDTDGDGNINVLDDDSDGDGLFDGTEVGNDCNGPGTNSSTGHCKADGDKGKTTTSMVDADTDNGGVSDGDEDFNKNGVFDSNQGEGDPNYKADDINVKPCAKDIDCGKKPDGTEVPNSGYVCDTDATPKHCVEGCRAGVEGSECPEGQVCIMTEGDPIGYCTASTNTTSGGGITDDVIVQGGCVCAMQPGSNKRDIAWTLLLSVGAALAWRRRRNRAA